MPGLGPLPTEAGGSQASNLLQKLQKEIRMSRSAGVGQTERLAAPDHIHVLFPRRRVDMADLQCCHSDAGRSIS